MPNLVVMKDKQVVTTSLNIAENFSKNHRDVLSAIDDLKEGVAENYADLFWEDLYIHPQNKQPYRMIYMNRDGFTLLAMGFTGKKAVQFKLDYIQAFNQMEQALIEQSKDSYMIDDPVKRAEKWIQERKQVQALELENAQLKPKALFAESVAAADTDILVNDLAKLLKQNGIDIGGTRLFAWLRENGYLIRRKGTDYNMPTQRSMDLELFRIKETTISRGNGRTSISKTPKVTGKGQVYFINKFLTKNQKIRIEG